MKTVLLIGAGGGMGSACACMLLNEGYRVIGMDRPGLVLPKGVSAIEADLTVSDSILSAFDKVKKQTDSINAIIYMAGIYDADSLVEIDEARMLRIFEINVFGAYRTVKAFLPLLAENARIVFVTSELADIDPLPFTGLYGITKSTTDRYAFSLAMELQLLNIKVSVIRPGAVETPLLRGSVSSIEAFTKKTTYYSHVAAKFLRVTESVEAKAISPYCVARKVLRVLSAKHPRFAYCLNRNRILMLYSILPKQLKLFAIRTFLKNKSGK